VWRAVCEGGTPLVFRRQLSMRRRTLGRHSLRLVRPRRELGREGAKGGLRHRRGTADRPNRADSKGSRQPRSYPPSANRTISEPLTITRRPTRAARKRRAASARSTVIRETPSASATSARE
jgi:hypothetical protein